MTVRADGSLSAAFERGELSFSKVRALVRVATPDSDGFGTTTMRLQIDQHAIVEQAVAKACRRKVSPRRHREPEAIVPLWAGERFELDACVDAVLYAGASSART